MSPEERELLNKAVSLAEDNNKILHYMKRSMHVSSIIKFIYWTIIIGSAIGAFYLFQPYINEIKNVFGGVSNELKNLKN